MQAGYDPVLNDHTSMPTETMRACTELRHVVFLGTGARSYLNLEELAAFGITVQIPKGYGDTEPSASQQPCARCKAFRVLPPGIVFYNPRSGREGLA